MIQNNKLVMDLLEQMEQLSDHDKHMLVEELLENNSYFLDYRIITKNTLVDELLFRVENAICEDTNAQEIQMFIEEYDTEQVFEILQDCCNGNELYDYSYWNENDGDVLQYIDFDEDEFVTKIHPLNTPARRERTLSSLGI